jgi:hypothetical protein
MTVQDAFIDVIGGVRVSTTSGRQQGPPQGCPNARAGCGEILRRDDGRKDCSLEGFAAPSEERRWAPRHRQCLPLTMSVFNQSAIFQAQMIDYSQCGMCVETGRPILPGTSVHLRIETGHAAETGKAVLQGLRTTELGEVKWCRAMGQSHSPRYHVGIRYYPYY